MTDPIADMLTRIRNANQMRYETVSMPKSNIKVEIAKILKNEGFIRDFQVKEEDVQGTIILKLKYGRNNERVISGIKRISKPGLRVYAKTNEVPKVFSGLGIAIVSTSNGLLTDRDCRKAQVGGEVLAYVW